MVCLFIPEISCAKKITLEELQSEEIKQVSKTGYKLYYQNNGIFFLEDYTNSLSVRSARFILNEMEYALDVYVKRWKYRYPTCGGDTRCHIKVYPWKEGMPEGEYVYDVEFEEGDGKSREFRLNWINFYLNVSEYDSYENAFAIYHELFHAVQESYISKWEHDLSWFRESTANAATHGILKLRNLPDNWLPFHVYEILKSFKYNYPEDQPDLKYNWALFFIFLKKEYEYIDNIKKVWEKLAPRETGTERHAFFRDLARLNPSETEVLQTRNREAFSNVFQRFAMSLILDPNYGAGSYISHDLISTLDDRQNGEYVFKKSEYLGLFRDFDAEKEVLIPAELSIYGETAKIINLKTSVDSSPNDSLLFFIQSDTEGFLRHNLVLGDEIMTSADGFYRIDNYNRERRPMYLVISNIEEQPRKVKFTGMIGEPPYLEKVIVKHEGNIIYQAEWMKTESGEKSFEIHVNNTTPLKDKEIVNLFFTLVFSRKIEPTPSCRVNNTQLDLKGDYGAHPTETYYGQIDIDLKVKENKTLRLFVEGKDMRDLKLNSRPTHRISIQDSKIVGYVPGADQNHEIRVGEKEVACEKLIRLADEYKEKANAAGEAAIDEEGRYIRELYSKPMPPRLATREAERQRAQAEWNKQQEKSLASQRQQNALNSNAFCYQIAETYLMALVVNVRKGQDELSNEEKKQCLEEMKKVGGFYNKRISKICPPDARAWCTPEKDAYEGGGLDECPSDIQAICSYTKAQCDPS